MKINWASFTPWLSLAGGAPISLSAALFIVFNGGIAGISGIARISGIMRSFFRQPQADLVLALLSRRSVVSLFEVLMHLSSQKRDSASLASIHQ